MLASLLAMTGCTRTLGFNFRFGSDDGGSGGNDLASANDLGSGNDMVKPVDQSIGDPPSDDLASPDLSVASPDLGGPDLFASADLAATKDLFSPDFRPQLDLRPQDLLPMIYLGISCDPDSSELNPCNPNDFSDVCLGSYDTGMAVVFISGGYCTKSCAEESDCTALGGHCRPLGVSGKFCMRACESTCPRNDTECCNFCATSGAGSTSCFTDKVCAPTDAPGYCVTP